MALFGLFGTGPLSQKKIDKIAKLAANPFAQPDVRMQQMRRLMDDGSDSALSGVLKRFAANANGHIADEDEKKWLEDTLVEHGDPALEPLRRYIRTETQLTYALRAYRRIAGDAEAVRFCIEVLQAYGPEHHRAADAKLQLVWQLGESLDNPAALPALIPFLEDHSDDVRWAVMDLVERAADGGRLTDSLVGAVCKHLTAAVTARDVGPRIQNRAAEMLAKREWQASGDVAELAPTLAETFFLDKKRYVRRRAKA